MDSVARFINAIGASRLIVMAVVTAGLIGFFSYLTVRLTAPPMGILYTNLELGDSAEIVARLDGMNVPYQITRDGSAVMVPQDQISSLRMELAQEGMPQGGSIGYEIFDDQDALGTTSFVQNINRVRALEGELSRTIRTLDRVSGARVHLVLPERQLFGKEEREPTASIVVKTRAQLLPQHIAAIQNLVAAAVPGLEVTNISIVDETGQLLSRPSSSADNILGSGIQDRRASVENRIKEQIEALITSHVGPGRVRAEVMAEVDFDRITLNHETYDPEGQVVRSTQTVEEEGLTNDSSSQAVSVSNNLPGQGVDTGAAEGQPSSTSSRIEETVNYEISRTVRTEIREAGRIQRLSVAVIVDGTYSLAEDGEVIYAPRPQAEMDQLKLLVASAIGFDEERGDNLEVINLPFSQPAGIEKEIEEPFVNLEKADYFRIGEVLVLGIVGILLILLVLRPFLNKLLATAPGLSTAGATAGAGGGAGGTDNFVQIEGPDGEMRALEAPPASYIETDEGLVPVDEDGNPIQQAQRKIQIKPPDDEVLVKLANVSGQVKESALKHVGQVVEKNPEQAANVVRTWLYEKT